MKLTSFIAILVLHSMPAPAMADDPPCPKTVGRIAIRLFPEDSLAGETKLQLKLQGKPLSSPAKPSKDPKLKDLWIFTSQAPLALADIGTLVPSAACIDFTQRTEPLIDRLQDGTCYATFEFLTKPTCWSLRVQSRPYGYPFEVRLGKQKQRFDRKEEDFNWNLVRDLPLDIATVEIFDNRQRTLSLLALEDVSYMSLKSDPEAWKLDQRKLQERFSVQDNQIEVADDAMRLVRQRLIQQLEYIHLFLDGAK